MAVTDIHSAEALDRLYNLTSTPEPDRPGQVEVPIECYSSDRYVALDPSQAACFGLDPNVIDTATPRIESTPEGSDYAIYGYFEPARGTDRVDSTRFGATLQAARGIFAMYELNYAAQLLLNERDRILAKKDMEPSVKDTLLGVLSREAESLLGAEDRIFMHDVTRTWLGAFATAYAQQG